MLNGRKSLITVLASAALVTFVGTIPSGTAQAQPSVSDVQHRVDRLYHAAERASERYNQIHVQLQQMRGDVKALRADESLQHRRTEQARRVVADAIVQEYEGDSLSAVGQAVVSQDPSQFVSQLSTMSAFNSLQTSRYASYITQNKALAIRQDATASQLAKVAQLEKSAAADKASIDKNLSDAKALLGNLQADARQRLARGLAQLPPRCPCRRPGVGSRGGRGALRAGPGRQGLRLRRCRSQRLRLLRSDDGRVGRRRSGHCPTPRVLSGVKAPTSHRASCSPVTWSSTTAPANTSACTSVTA